MRRARLFVRSKRTTGITGRVSVESIGAAHTTTDYSEGSTYATLPPEDARAVSILKGSGVEFEQVDLSKGARGELAARYRGVSETPTLLGENTSMKSYVGAKAISRYVAAVRSQRGNTASGRTDS